MVIFDPTNHTYKNPESGEFYKSVSTLLSQYKKPFDAKFFSKIVAKREGVSQQAILDKWDKNTQEACIKGKDIHSIIEGYIKNDAYDIENLSLIDEFKKVFNKEEFKVFHSEKILFSDEHKVAGTSDCIADNIKGNTFDVYDFKTNKNFQFFNKYNEYLLKPLEHLQNCHFNVYALQLSLYAFLYSKMSGKSVRKLALYYYDDTKFNYINVPYMRWDIAVLLKHYGSNHPEKS
jgi:hypothetical protein